MTFDAFLLLVFLMTTSSFNYSIAHLAIQMLREKTANDKSAQTQQRKRKITRMPEEKSTDVAKKRRD